MPDDTSKRHKIEQAVDDDSLEAKRPQAKLESPGNILISISVSTINHFENPGLPIEPLSMGQQQTTLSLIKDTPAFGKHLFTANNGL